MSWRLATTLLATGALAISCHAALSLDDLELVDGNGGGGGSSTSTSTSGTGGTGGIGGTGGSGGAECDPDLCPGSDTDCTKRVCTDDGECDIAHEPVGTSCTGPDDEHVCDGEGTCVECNGTDDCAGSDVCDDHNCVPVTCTDGQQNGNETDVDCGGGDCAPCANDEACLVATDCQSGFCDSLVCMPCATEAECQTAEYCDGNQECQPQKADGLGCTADIECLNGNCPTQDGICCDTPCDVTCEACQGSKTGGTDGTCAPVTANDDFDGECTDQGAASCGPNGTGCRGNEARCHLYDNQAVCSPATCTNDVMTTEALCDGSGTCDTPQTVPCPPYACDTNLGACYTDCTLPSHCSSANTCIIGTQSTGYCGTALTFGGACSFDFECQSNMCRDGVCCDSNCGGPCRSCLAAETPQTTDGYCDDVIDGNDPDSDCQSPPADVCNGDGACRCNDSLHNGDESDVDCGGSICGYCQNGDACIAASDCVNGNCPAQDGVCCDAPCNQLCESCLAWKSTATADGLCSPVTPGQNPDDDCVQDDANCEAPSCSGTVGQCTPAQNGILCRAAPLPCDVPENCDGINVGCPQDLVVPQSSNQLCRLSTEPACDPAEYCDGNNPDCPPDSYANPGTACDNQIFCDGADACDGNGACVASNVDPCPGPDNDADCTESCWETWQSCDAQDPENASCDGGNSFCHYGECCHFGDPPTGTGCPSECTGGCNGGLCIIECQSANECAGSTIQCPQGFECQLKCTGASSCENAQLTCPNFHTCDVTCGNTSACKGMAMVCRPTGPCAIDCTADLDSCLNTTVACSFSSCDATCAAPANAPTLDCGSSCDCNSC